MRAANLWFSPSRRLVLAAYVLLAACGQWDDQNRAIEVAREALGCFDVELERTENHRFHAAGCGGSADIACSEGSLNPVCIRVAARGTSGGEVVDEVDELETDPDAPSDGSIAASAPGEEASDLPSEAELAIRRGLDARAADVLACVDRPSVAVRVTHAADGHLTIALSGDLRGSPEEGCVRAALGDVRGPAGEPGVVLHLVRRSAEPTTEPPPEPTTAPVMEGTIVEQLD